MQWDIQVAAFLLVVVTFSAIRNALVHGEPRPNVWATVPTWLVLAVWLLVASWCSDTYRQHRTLFVLSFKTFLAAAVLHLTNDGGRLVGTARTESSTHVLLLKAVSLHGLVHLPALCVGLPLPFWPQLFWILARTAMFCLGRATRELVGVANTQTYFLQDLSSLNLWWAHLVQSGSDQLISRGPALQDRSSAMTLAMLTMHVSAAALSLYLAHMSQWLQVRTWLQDKAGCRETGHQQQQRQRERAHLLDVGGVLLTPQQLQDLARSPAATLLLEGRGVPGWVSMACFHACIANMILLAALLLSQVLVLQVGPAVMPGPVLAAFYPRWSQPGMGVSQQGEEPLKLSGFWGCLLFVLAV